MGRKSNRHTTWCKMVDTEDAADGCRRKANVATMKEDMCIPCWQKKHAKSLNKRKNMWSFEGSKKRLMEIPIDDW